MATVSMLFWIVDCDRNTSGFEGEQCFVRGSPHILTLLEWLLHVGRHLWATKLWTAEAGQHWKCNAPILKYSRNSHEWSMWNHRNSALVEHGLSEIMLITQLNANIGFAQYYISAHNPRCHNQRPTFCQYCTFCEPNSSLGLQLYVTSWKFMVYFSITLYCLSIGSLIASCKSIPSVMYFIFVAAQTFCSKRTE